MPKYTIEKCNAKDFQWVNKNVADYPIGTRNNQYHKSKYFSLETYLDERRIKSYLDFIKVRGLIHYIYIKHDKDFNKDGEPIAPHFHILIEFDHAHNCRPIISAVNLCGDHCRDPTFRSERTSLQWFEDGDELGLYLFHLTPGAIADGKHQYGFDECVSDDIDHWINFGKITTVGRMELIWNDFYDGLTPYQMSIKYGKDFVINFRSYQTFYVDYVESELKNKYEVKK